MTKDKDKAEENNSQKYLIEKEYNDIVIRQTGFDLYYVSDVMKDYTDSLSTENAQLREALRELVALSEAESGDDIVQYEMDFDTALTYSNTMFKAKQLLTDNTKQDEKED